VKYTPPGQHKNFAAFRAHLRSIDDAFDADEVLLGAEGPLGQPLEVAGRTLGNRFAIQPMEGWDGTRAGLPTEHTLRRWRNFGRSTAKLIWGGEAFAVREDGRANPHQLFQNTSVDVSTTLAQLLAEVHAGHREVGASIEDLVVGLQLTHSGRFARPDGEPAPRLVVHNPVLDARFEVARDLPLLTDGELGAIGESYVSAACAAYKVGYQFVDLKACHGYLMHELLGARGRPGPYGGSLENRTRLLREILAGIRSACPGLEVGVRVSIADVFPHVADPDSGVGVAAGWEGNLPYDQGFGMDQNDPRGFDLSEPLRFLGLLRELGIRLVNLSLGSPYTCPHLQRPATYPPSDGYLPPVDPLQNVIDHLRVVRACKAAHPDLVLVGSGYSYLMEYLPHVAQHEVGQGHVDLVGLGRMVLVYPELPRDVLAGKPLDRKRICRTFSDCTTGPRLGLISGCFPLDPYYRDLPEAGRLRGRKRSVREN